MSVSGSSTSGTDRSSYVVGSMNPMYVTACYDQITLERMVNGHRLPPTYSRGTQELPPYTGNTLEKSFPANVPLIQSSIQNENNVNDDYSCGCSYLVMVYVLAVLLVVFSLVALCLTLLLWFGIVPPTGSNVAAQPAVPTDSPSSCSCPGVCVCVCVYVCLYILS